MQTRAVSTGHIGGLLIALVLLGGCVGGEPAGNGAPASPEPPQAPRDRWQQARPTDYSFLLEASCGERALLGSYQVTVRGGEVAAVEGQGSYSRRMVERGLPIPSIDELWDEAEEARRNGADVVELEFDETYGYPNSIIIDWSGGVDDEACYEVTDFMVQEGSGVAGS